MISNTGISIRYEKDRLDELKDDHEVIQYLKSEPISRSFPNRASIKHEARATLSKILEEGSLQYSRDDMGMEICYRMRWAHQIPVGEVDGDVVILPLRLQEKWLEYIIGKAQRPLPERFNRLDVLCLAILKEF